MNNGITRREYLRETALLGMAVTAASAVEAAPRASRGLPRIRLGKLEVSRLILGSNPFFGFSHKNAALDNEMREFFIDERIVGLLDETARLGVTAVAAPPYERWIGLWARYRDRGGKLASWIAQPDLAPAEMPGAIDASVKGGAAAVVIQGARVDEQFRDERGGRIRDWLERIRDAGLPAGMASHRPDTHLRAQELGMPVDFFFQCFYTNDEFRSEDRDRAVETVKRLQKPVIGYKILAAGRNDPKEAFAYAFRHLRDRDGVCVGIYPKTMPAMIVEDVGYVRKARA